MKCPRIFATSDRESRFEDVSVPLAATQLVPGRPAVEVGPAIATSGNLAASWGRLGSKLASNSKALVLRNVSGRTGVHHQRREDAALRPGEHLFSG